MAAKAKAPRVHYHEEHGWLVDTVFPMTRRQLQVCVDFARRIQADRLRGLPLGPERDRRAAALKNLSVATLRQNLQPAHPWEKEKTAYLATAGHESKRIIVGAN